MWWAQRDMNLRIFVCLVGLWPHTTTSPRRWHFLCTQTLLKIAVLPVCLIWDPWVNTVVIWVSGFGFRPSGGAGVAPEGTAACGPSSAGWEGTAFPQVAEAAEEQSSAAAYLGEKLGKWSVQVKETNQGLLWWGNTCCTPGPLLVVQGGAFHAGVHSILCPQQTAVCFLLWSEQCPLRMWCQQVTKLFGCRQAICLCRRANTVFTNATVCRGGAALGTAHDTGPVQAWQQLTWSLSSFISQSRKFSRNAPSLQPLQLTRIILSI